MNLYCTSQLNVLLKYNVPKVCFSRFNDKYFMGILKTVNVWQLSMADYKWNVNWTGRVSEKNNFLACLFSGLCLLLFYTLCVCVVFLPRWLLAFFLQAYYPLSSWILCKENEFEVFQSKVARLKLSSSSPYPYSLTSLLLLLYVSSNRYGGHTCLRLVWQRLQILRASFAAAEIAETYAFSNLNPIETRSNSLPINISISFAFLFSICPCLSCIIWCHLLL